MKKMDEKMNNTKGRLKKIVILEHRGWVILLEPNFPSNNYILTRMGASHGFHPAYCNSLESAINMLFNQLVIMNIEETIYDGSLTDLRRVILQTKDEFRTLLSNDVRALLCEGGGDV